MRTNGKRKWLVVPLLLGIIVFGWRRFGTSEWLIAGLLVYFLFAWTWFERLERRA